MWLPGCRTQGHRKGESERGRANGAMKPKMMRLNAATHLQAVTKSEFEGLAIMTSLPAIHLQFEYFLRDALYLSPVSRGRL